MPLIYAFVLQMNIIPGGFYDGLMLYAHALNESLAENQGRRSKESVTKRMWNRTYYGEPLHDNCMIPDESCYNTQAQCYP